ncbi:MAG: polysaccharide pyruvyl transferase family protein [Brooklawnia sp.]|uniref:polysaccharide pyruvyl transferase family protein n=1 Tax=Brooklawnia sp. TaxID=2699740 RepID=UPI003C74759E
MRVGLMGVHCDNANLGVVALAYSAVGLLHRVVPGEAEVVLFSANRQSELDRMAEVLGVRNKRFWAAPLYRRKPAVLMQSLADMRRCDVVLDFTGGDSFSDIYGARRLVNKLLDKQLVLACGVPLLLAPQTYGPFQRRALLPWVRHVLNRATLVAARDDLSGSFLAELTRREVIAATDVAVTLPWQPGLFDLPDTDLPRVGFNVSGLLWNGGYTGDNQFRLRADYRQYCHDVIEGMLAGGFQVHLVPHVISRGDAGREDDAAAARQLLAEYSDCVLAPPFTTPVEAKSYISRLDAFLGSRMHATIAAFTTGVPTIPVAYSRKFAGFYQGLGYPIVVDLTELATTAASRISLGYVHDRGRLAELVAAGRLRADDRIAVFTNRLAEWLSGQASGVAPAVSLDTKQSPA